MRALKTMLIIVASLLGLLIILGLVLGRGSFRVERSVVIKAPVAAVYPHISSLGAMEEWAPWKDDEPDMVSTFSGAPDGQVGAISHWKSSRSEGEQEITALVPNEQVRTKVRFIAPWQAEHEGTLDLVAMGDSTRLTWGLQGENGFIARIMGVFRSMDAMVGPLYERGLARLGALAEKEHAEATKAPAWNIITIERPAMLYVGRRAVVKWADLKAFYTVNFGEGMAAVTKAGLSPAGPPSGVFFAWNEQDQTADMIAGIPVAPGARKKLEGQEVFEAPAGKALLIDHVGPYSATGKAHEAMDAYMQANDLVQGGVMLEEYITDPGQEPDSTKWHTNIIYMVK